jgi:hypothetical protein
VMPEQANDILGKKKSAFNVLQFRTSDCTVTSTECSYSYSDDGGDGHVDSGSGDNLPAFAHELEVHKFE